MIDYSSLSRTSSVPIDLNPVDILKPMSQFTGYQQQKQQQGYASKQNILCKELVLIVLMNSMNKKLKLK
ncbi:unnamed protein product [Rotaria sp. Silwood2]|nr:unnamed protein product [Rotaria sp. Silwood2]